MNEIELQELSTAIQVIGKVESGSMSGGKGPFAMVFHAKVVLTEADRKHPGLIVSTKGQSVEELNKIADAFLIRKMQVEARKEGIVRTEDAIIAQMRLALEGALKERKKIPGTVTLPKQ